MGCLRCKFARRPNGPRSTTVGRASSSTRRGRRTTRGSGVFAKLDLSQWASHSITDSVTATPSERLVADLIDRVLNGKLRGHLAENSHLDVSRSYREDGLPLPRTPYRRSRGGRPFLAFVGHRGTLYTTRDSGIERSLLRHGVRCRAVSGKRAIVIAVDDGSSDASAHGARQPGARVGTTSALQARDQRRVWRRSPDRSPARGESRFRIRGIHRQRSHQPARRSAEDRGAGKPRAHVHQRFAICQWRWNGVSPVLAAALSRRPAMRWARRLFGIQLRDVTNGFRAVRTDLFLSWPLKERGFAIIMEELDSALQSGGHTCGVPHRALLRGFAIFAPRPSPIVGEHHLFVSPVSHACPDQANSSGEEYQMD